MAEVCDCSLSLSNTGRPGCVPIFNVINNLILMPMEDNDGNDNGIDLSLTIDPAYFVGRVNETDASKRWYPLPGMEEVDNPKAESIKKEYSSGRTVKIRDGKRSFTGQIIGKDATPEFNGQLQSVNCVRTGFIAADVDGNGIGDYNATTNFLSPIPIDDGSWDSMWMWVTDSEPTHILVQFDWDRNYDDRNLKMITVAEAGGQDFTKLEGLIDVIFSNEVVSIGGLTAIFDTVFIYGTAPNPTLYKGAILVADWGLFNVSTDTAMTVDSVDENPDGSYTLDFTDIVSTGDVVSITVLKEGFSGTTNVTATA